ncbi:Hydrolase YafV (fragment) [uncultured Paludibacter sp.]|uniref:Hydrolase YafV n=1 Tax=uncultured Paludibacter sp. TaxID=497635 RepID=A0A653AE88_9BACT
MDAWDALLPARAIENQAYVCGVNRIGTDGMNISYSGHSVLLDFKGKTIMGFDENEENIKTTELFKLELEKFREKYAFWKDVDNFEIVGNE